MCYMRWNLRSLLTLGMVLAMAQTATAYITNVTDIFAEATSRRYEPRIPSILATPLDFCRIDATDNTWHRSIATNMPGNNQDTFTIGYFVPCSQGPVPYSAFNYWCYSQILATECEQVAPLPLEQGPLYLSDWQIKTDNPNLPTPTYRACFEPITGLDHLRNIPLECTNSSVPAVASARYRIQIDGEASPWNPDGIRPVSEAMFFLTAIYDESLFDVSVADQGEWPYGSWVELQELEAVIPNFNSVWIPLKEQPLRSREPLPFVGVDFQHVGTPFGKYDAYWQIPEYVIVRLKPNHSLEEAQGRKVQLMLHTVDYAYNSAGEPPSYGQDAMHFWRTGYVEVGVEGKVEDWRIQPPPLKDACIPPSFDSAEQKGVEADVVGTSVVNNLNVDLPSMRVGHNHFRVGRTLSETLGNEACYEAFWTRRPNDANTANPQGLATEGEYYDFSFVRVNMHGVWFSVGCVPSGQQIPSEMGDAPGWWAQWDYAPDGRLRLNVYDAYSNLVYRYFANKKIPNSSDPLSQSDYAFATAKLVEVDEASTGHWIRKYVYADPTCTTLTLQKDNKGNQISYSFDAVTKELTVIGNGTRTIRASFGLSPGAGTQYCLRGASCGLGDAWRQYEWNPMHVPFRPSDGQLKSVRDADGNYLAYLQYEPIDGSGNMYSKGRLIAWSRGPASDPEQDMVAEYDWIDPTYTWNSSLGNLPPPPQNTTLDAKFYVNEFQYELVSRQLNPMGQLVRLTQHWYLHPLIKGDDIISDTTYDYRVQFDGCPPGDDKPYWNITTLPGSSLAQYVCYDPIKGDNIVESFFGPPPTQITGGGKQPPPNDQRRNWFSYDYSSFVQENGQKIWQKTLRTDHSRGNAQTIYQYDAKGFLQSQIDPEITMADGQTVQAQQSSDYVETGDTKFQYDYRKADTQETATTSTEYTYDDYGYPSAKKVSDRSGALSPLQYGYHYDVFGQLQTQTDADGFVNGKDYDPVTGLLTSTYVYEQKNATSGNALQQTTYEYKNGRIWKIHVANSLDAFNKINNIQGLPASVDTEFGYDGYGRLTSKTVAGFTTSYGYDSQDRLAWVAWPDGRSKQILRDGRGQISEIDYCEGTLEPLTSTYEFDALGNLKVRTTDGCPKCGKKTTYQYDSASHRISETRIEVAK